jgi:hypothetical protein
MVRFPLSYQQNSQYISTRIGTISQIRIIGISQILFNDFIITVFATQHMTVDIINAKTVNEKYINQNRINTCFLAMNAKLKRVISAGIFDK